MRCATRRRTMRCFSWCHSRRVTAIAFRRRRNVRHWSDAMSQIVNTRCVLAVRDLAVSTRYYMDILGLQRDFGDGTDGWSFLSRGAFRVMLGECVDETPAGELGKHSWYAYVNVEGVDELYAEFTSRGAELLSPIATKPWGMRDFTVRTQDGHRIVFGEAVR